MKKSRFTDSQTCYRYTPTLSDEHERIADWLVRLTHNQRIRGFCLCFLYLRNVKRFGWNHTQAEIDARRLTPLPGAAKNGGITELNRDYPGSLTK